VFDRLALEFHAEAGERELRLSFARTRLVVRTDPLLLQRILGNLIANALRYTPAGGVLVGARRRGDRVVLEVLDTGIGIPPEQQQRVFEEFYQVGNPGRDRRRGLGLGLAIVRRLVGLIDADIQLDSVPGRGTRLCLRLPRSRAPAEPLPTALAMRLDRALQDRRVLVVEDDSEVRLGTAHLLTGWGMQTRTARDPAEAQQVVDDGFVPEVVVADLRLGTPEDGIAVIQRLRERLGSKLPALLVSGDTQPAELQRIRASGLALLSKPVAPAKLRSALHAGLSGSDLSSAARS
jgi:CheY-like chemotaxis protein